MNSYSSIKLLYFSINYAPNNTVGTFRTLKLSKYFAQLGIKQFIFTIDSKENTNLKLNLEIPESAIIYRKKSIIPQNQAFAAQNVKKNVLSKIKYCIKDLLFSPDKYIWWSLSFLPKMIHVIKKEKINAIIVCGDPFSPFIVGYILKKIFKITLILDFRDPWKNNIINLKQSLIRKLVDSFWEKKCVKNADIITSVTDQIVDSINSYNPAGKVLKISNGFDLVDFTRHEKILQTKKFIFLYTGKYNVQYEDYNPEQVAIAFDKFLKRNQITNAQLIFIGLTNDKTKQLLNRINKESIVCYNLIPKSEVIKMQQTSDVLVHFYYPKVHTGAISLKIYEYALSGKPIISFNICEGELYDFIKNNQLGETVSSHDIEGMVNLLKKAYDGNIKITDNPYEKLKEYDMKNIAQKLAEYIWELIKHH